jgi:hypothetical protein
MWSLPEVVGFLLAAVALALGADQWWLFRERRKRGRP